MALTSTAGKSRASNNHPPVGSSANTARRRPPPIGRAAALERPCTRKLLGLGKK
jgi:hypothetical protein